METTSKKDYTVVHYRKFYIQICLSGVSVMQLSVQINIIETIMY